MAEFCYFYLVSLALNSIPSSEVKFITCLPQLEMEESKKGEEAREKVNRL